MRNPIFLLSLIAMALLQACATPSPDDKLDARALAAKSTGYSKMIEGVEAQAKTLQAKAAEDAAKLKDQKDRAQIEAAERYRVFPGTNVTVKPSVDSNQPSGDSTATLSFEATDIRDVAKTILFDILGENYYIDPQVGGNVTFRTVKPIPRNSLVPILEMLLRGVNSALVKEAGIYKVVPATQAVRGTLTPQLIGGTGQVPLGYSVVVMPLKHIGIKEMLRILEPFAKEPTAIRGDELRNLVILTGTEREIRHLLETIEMFDIDWMAGMSVGFFQLHSVDVKTVMKEMESLFGNKDLGPIGGLFRVVPIERLNALLVISPQRSAIDRARDWIERLDSGSSADGQRLYVYHLQNARADKLAPILQQAITGRTQQQTTPQVAPGQTPVTLGTAQNPASLSQPRPQTPVPTPAVPVAPPAVPGAPGAPASAENLVVSRNVQIIADKDNNAIVVLATQTEYAVIETAIRKLDLAPRQVLIEAKIARVTLTGTFKLGLNWAFQNGLRIGTGNILSINPAAGNTPENPFAISNVTKFPTNSGFNYAWSNILNGGDTINMIFNLLASDSRTRVVSTPSLIATDNQKSSIQVGQSIPTVTGSTVTPGTVNGVVTSNQYVNTGVQISVTPRVNQGGQVTLEMDLELSSVADSSPVPGTPAFNKTSASSIVTVQSGQTILLGGLIEETSGKLTSGLPFISQIPVLGALFGEQEKKDNRQELIMLVTPTLVPANIDLTDMAADLRRKMQYLQDEFPVKRNPNPQSDTKALPALDPSVDRIAPSPGNK